MRRQDKSRIIREANEKLEERYLKILLKEDILNESRYGEYLENTLFKKLGLFFQQAYSLSTDNQIPTFRTRKK